MQQVALECNWTIEYVIIHALRVRVRMGNFDEG